MGLSAVALGFLGVLCLAAATPPVEVDVDGGRLSGYWRESRKGRPIASFEGIPYAKPPLGDLRFQAPEPAEPWKGVLEVKKPGPVCVQRNLYFGQKDVVGSEDCLQLNVYAPDNVDAARRLDVMVWIHGGGWISGSGDIYGPEYLADADVILVTFNYRLGPLGFLSTGDDVVPGNAGLKDMVQALRWVQKNIAAFGGNPDSVTIFGESAGGASVHHLMLSPLAKGLFHKAISQSGVAFTTGGTAPPAEPRRNARILAKFVGCPATPSSEFRKCLLTKSAVDITAVDLTFVEWGISPMIPFKPTVELGSAEGAFHERHPIDTIKTYGPPNDVPFMTGFTSHEGCIVAVGVFLNDTAFQEYRDDFEHLTALVMLLSHLPEPILQESFKKIRHHYFGEGPIDKDDVFNVIDMYTDSMFAWPALNAVKLQVKHGKSPVYVYELAHTNTRSFSQLFGSKGADFGVCHGDDLIQLFPLRELFPDYERSADDLLISNKVVEYFTNFAKNGKPTADNSWQRVAHPSEAEYLHIGSPGDIGMRANFAPKRMQLWSDLPLNLGRSPSTHDEL